MKVTLRGPTELRFCPNCTSSHIGPACGTSFRDRLRSVRLDPSVTPTRERINYFEDAELKDIFGKDRKERKEEMLDDTKGLGPIGQDVRKANKLLNQGPIVDEE